MSEGIIEAPEGIRFDINIYATSIKDGIDSVLRIGNLPAVAPFGDEMDLPALLANFPPVEGGWRLMTNEEIKEYREAEREDDEHDLTEH